MVYGVSVTLPVIEACKRKIENHTPVSISREKPYRHLFVIVIKEFALTMIRFSFVFT